jgi:anti-anti-sigma factor
VAELAIDTRKDGDVVHLSLGGEFDLAGVPQFQAVIAKVEADAPAAIVLDLSDLDFMDSSGLRAIVTADARARKAGRRLAIVPGPPSVRGVFQITGLDAQLELIEDAESVSAG